MWIDFVWIGFVFDWIRLVWGRVGFIRFSFVLDWFGFGWIGFVGLVSFRSVLLSILLSSTNRGEPGTARALHQHVLCHSSHVQQYKHNTL